MSKSRLMPRGALAVAFVVSVYLAVVPTPVEAVCGTVPVPPPSPINSLTTCFGPNNVIVPSPTNDGVLHLGGDLGNAAGTVSFDVGAGNDIMLMSGLTDGNGARLNGGTGFDGLFLIGGNVSNLRVRGWDFAALTAFSRLSPIAGTHTAQFIIVDPTSTLGVTGGDTVFTGTLGVGAFSAPTVLTLFGRIDMRDGAVDDRLTTGVFIPSSAEIAMDISLLDETSDRISVPLLTTPAGTNEVIHNFTTMPAFNQVVGGPIGLVTVDGLENPVNDLTGGVNSVGGLLGDLPGFLSALRLPGFSLSTNLPDLVATETPPAPLLPSTNPFSIVPHPSYIFQSDPSTIERFFFLEPGSANGVYLSWMPNPSLPAEDLLSTLAGTNHGVQSVVDVLGHSLVDELPNKNTADESGEATRIWARGSAVKTSKDGLQFNPLRKANNALFRVTDRTGDVDAWTSYMIMGIEHDLLGGMSERQADGVLRLGAQSGYVRNQLSVANPLAPFGFGGPAESLSHLFLAGLYATGQYGPFYAAGTLNGIIGRTEIDAYTTTFDDNSTFTTSGYVANGYLGARIPVGAHFGIDLRGWASHGELHADDHFSRIGFDIGDGSAVSTLVGGSVGIDVDHVDENGDHLRGLLRVGIEEELTDEADATVNQVAFAANHDTNTLLTLDLTFEYAQADGSKVQAFLTYTTDLDGNLYDDEALGAGINFVIPFGTLQSAGM